MNSVLFGILCVGLFILGLYIGLSFIYSNFAEHNLGLECCKLSHDVHSFRGGIMINGKWEEPEEPLVFKKGKVIGQYDTCLLKEGEVKVDYVSLYGWGTVCLLDELESAVNYIFYYFLTVAVLLGTIAGYQYRNIDDKPEEVKSAGKKKGKRLLILAVILSAAAILIKCELINFLSSVSM